MASYKRAGTNLYDLVDRFFNDGFSVNTPLKNIILDVQEFDDKFIVEADVPGVDKKDINVTFNNDYLKIALEASDEIDDKVPSATSTEKTEEQPTEKSEDTGVAMDATEGADKQATTKKENINKSEQTQKKTMSTDDNEGHYIHRERMFATVNRVVYLKGATSKGIKAELKDGVLTLIVPKREDAMNQNQTIDID